MITLTNGAITSVVSTDFQAEALEKRGFIRVSGSASQASIIKGNYPYVMEDTTELIRACFRGVGAGAAPPGSYADLVCRTLVGAEYDNILASMDFLTALGQDALRPIADLIPFLAKGDTFIAVQSLDTVPEALEADGTGLVYLTQGSEDAHVGLYMLDEISEDDEPVWTALSVASYLPSPAGIPPLGHPFIAGYSHILLKNYHGQPKGLYSLERSGRDAWVFAPENLLAPVALDDVSWVTELPEAATTTAGEMYVLKSVHGEYEPNLYVRDVDSETFSVVASFNEGDTLVQIVSELPDFADAIEGTIYGVTDSELFYRYVALDDVSWVTELPEAATTTAGEMYVLKSVHGEYEPNLYVRDIDSETFSVATSFNEGDTLVQIVSELPDFADAIPEGTIYGATDSELFYRYVAKNMPGTWVLSS